MNLIFKNLWYRKTRTFLTVLGIAMGVAAVVALSAFGEGIASGFETMLSSSDADLQVGQKDAVMLIMSTVDEEIGAEITQLPGVKTIAGTVIGFIQMPEAPYFIVVGEEPRSFAMQHYRIIAGQPITGKRQILLGKLAAKNFKKDVGQKFRINNTSYRIVGIYETGVSFEEGGAVMGLTDAQRAFDKRHQVNYFNIQLKDVRRSAEVKERIETSWEDLTAIRSGEATQQDESLTMYRSFGWFLGIFAILVGGLGMMNTTLMSVLERTREIGVLRAVGWRRRRVIGMIIGESLIIALSGGLLGIVLGFGLISLTRLSPAVESLLSGVITPGMLIQALVVALLLGTVGGVYPAWRAAKLAPIDAMRRDSGGELQWGKTTQTIMRTVGSGSLRNLARRSTRTLVTISGIGIGVGFIVALMAITEGFVDTFTELASAGQADLLAEQAKASDLAFSAIDERTADRIRLEPEVRSVSKMVMGVTSAPGMPYLIIFGLDPHEEYIQHYRIREGRMIQRSREVMVGRFAADGLEKQIGDTLRIGGSSYDIVGIYENGSPFEDTGSAIMLKDSQRLLRKPRQVTLLSIGLHDPAHAEEIAQQLEQKFPDVMVSPAATFTDRMQDIATTYAILNALIVLTMIVGGVVMMNAMLMSVFERTQEIGVLRAVGWKRQRILRMILIESLALSMLSLAMGMLIGVSLSYLFMLAPTYGAFLAPIYSANLFIQVTLLTLALGVIGGTYPAWRAANLQPIEALRYE